ncbi:hypothetical protein [Candidatus Endomicrobiellum devescovinae]|jgi:hypothetical protein|uniref:hypothetical protein n=1 Tax=Candidatus Endomicrobiellum devescovinae TaxID=3242322 RepID=UPI00282D3D2C|nr:hypothetical protein [Endomicrobium sp.]
MFCYKNLLLLFFLICLTAIKPLAATGNKEHSIGFEISGYKYQEVYDGEKFMSIEGERYGLSYEYLSRKSTEKSSFWSYQVDLSYGDLIYDGASQDGKIKFKVNCRTDWYQEHRLLYGLALPFNDNASVVMPYLGFAFRGLFNRINDYDYIKDGKPAKIVGYDRYSLYLYIPLGIILRAELANDWLFSLNPEFDLFLLGQQTSGIDTNGSRKPIKNAQHRGYGFRVSSRVSKKIGDEFAVFLEPFVKYWDIANSDIVNGYLEPKNNTVEYGVKVGITF